MSAIAGVLGSDSCFSRAAIVRGWQGGAQQLFHGRGSRWRDPGDRCQGGGVSSQQVMQAAKAHIERVR
jgi:hypothetical protein